MAQIELTWPNLALPDITLTWNKQG